MKTIVNLTVLLSVSLLFLLPALTVFMHFIKYNFVGKTKNVCSLNALQIVLTHQVLRPRTFQAIGRERDRAAIVPLGLRVTFERTNHKLLARATSNQIKHMQTQIQYNYNPVQAYTLNIASKDGGWWVLLRLNLAIITQNCLGNRDMRSKFYTSNKWFPPGKYSGLE